VKVRMIPVILLVILLASAQGMLLAQEDTYNPDGPNTPTAICTHNNPASEPTNRDYAAAEQVLDPALDYYAVFCTEAGAVYVDLLEDETPITVNNFVFLAQNGYYNNTTFHRVLEGFMAQGGDPTATGSGGPGYQFEDEFLPALTFDRPGLLAMANAGPGTNGSQFFLTTVPTPHLNGGHTIFGRVLRGQANVRALRLRDPGDPAAAQTPGASLTTVVIITDPAQVILDEGSTTALTRDEVIAALDAADTLLAGGAESFLENLKLSQTTDELLAAASAELSPALEAVLVNNNHQYRVGSVFNNFTCDLTNLDFYSIGYTIDAFASPNDAAAALADETFPQTQVLAGLAGPQSNPGLPNPYYSGPVTVCDTAAVRSVTHYLRGGYLITVEATLPPESSGLQALDQVFGSVLGTYESLLGDLYYRDIE
jgi:cyclophilin family peptidyl-prolyl cis-trans isomerase